MEVKLYDALNQEIDVLYQFDHDIRAEFIDTGLEGIDKIIWDSQLVHYGLSVLGTIEDGVIKCDVPNKILLKSYTIKVYLYYGSTRKEFELNIVGRKQASDEIYEETQIRDYDELVAKTKEIIESCEVSVERAAESASSALSSAESSLRYANSAEEYASQALQSKSDVEEVTRICVESEKNAELAKNEAVLAKESAEKSAAECADAKGVTEAAMEDAVDAKNAAEAAQQSSLENANRAENAEDAVKTATDGFDSKVESANSNFEDKVDTANTNFDGKVVDANIRFDNKVNAANTGFDNKVLQANTDFDAKTTSANNAIDAKVSAVDGLASDAASSAKNAAESERNAATYAENAAASATDVSNALEKVNDDNESYQQLKNDVVAAKDAVEEAVSDYKASITEATEAKTALETATSTANTAKSNLTNATTTANTAKSNLTDATSTANTAKSNLETATTNANTATSTANTAKTNLDASTTKANTAKSNLDSSVTTAGTAKSNLDAAVNTAETAKSNLEGAITKAGTSKSNLEGTITSAETAQDNLSDVTNTANTKIDTLNGANSLADSNKAALDTKNSTAASNITALDDANFNAKEILTGVEDIKAYLGYTDEDIVGVQVDYQNKSFQRLAGAYDLTGGADFNNFEMFGGRKRCNVADDGTIVAWFGDADYKEDGSMGQVMVYQPKFYYKVVPLKIEQQSDGVGYHLRKANYYVSTKAKTGFKLHPAFYDASGNEVDYILLSAFEGALWDASENTYITDNKNCSAQAVDLTNDKLCSVSGAQPISYITRPNLETLAKNLGDGWHGDLIKAESANQLLMIIEMGMMNLQSAIANGVVSITDNSSYNCSSLTGSTASLGNETGQAASTIDYLGAEQTANGKTSVSYRGVENPWGNIWKIVYGINIYGNGSQKGGIPYICTDFNFAESKNSGNYESAGFTLSNVNGYISAMGYGAEEYDWLIMPSECTGNSSLPVGDYSYFTADLNGYRIVLLGGTWYNGSYAGAFYWYCNNGVGYRDRGIGGRLAYVPTKDNVAYLAAIESWKVQMAA